MTSHGKAFMVNEFGWDRTNWKSSADLQWLLDTIARGSEFPEMGTGRCRHISITLAFNLFPLIRMI